jgi:thiamine biosynthesis lipoprotein ApbE
VRRADSLLSTWRDDSEISRLNHAHAGRPVRLSPELYGLLRESARWSASTSGAFDPAVGALVDAWDLRGAGRIPSPRTLAAARSRSGMALFRFADSRASVTRRCAGAWIDTPNPTPSMSGGNPADPYPSARRAPRSRGIVPIWRSPSGPTGHSSLGRSQ